MKKLLAKIRKILHDRRTRRFLTRFVSGVAALVVFVTTYALVLPAITMEKEANCGIEAHQHDDSCYTEELICDIPESDGHHHDESCYSTTSALVCETEEHEHSAENGCYDDEGNLICEVMEHRHNEECYEEVRELTCQIPESEGHHHTEDCYEKVLTCGKEVHVHSTACYENDPVSESAIAASTSSAAASTTSAGSVSSAGMTLNFEGDIEKIIDADEPVDGDSVDNLGADETNRSSVTNDTSGIASSSETNTEAASDTEVTYGRENAGTGRTETSNTALTNADNSATALTSSADTDQYIPQLDAVDFNTVLNNHTGIYYHHAADEETVEDSSAIPAEDWNRIPNNIDRMNDDLEEVELGKNDLLRVYLSYTIPAGSLNATNPVARYRLPGNIHLSDAQVKAINENVNGIACQYVNNDILEITDPEKYNASLGIEAVEGARTPDQNVDEYLEALRLTDGEDAAEYISATVKVENVYDSDGTYGEKGACLGQDLIFTFTPYTIQKNQHEYDASGQPTRAGKETEGWLTLDFNLAQIDWSEATVGTFTRETAEEEDTVDATEAENAGTAGTVGSVETKGNAETAVEKETVEKTEAAETEGIVETATSAELIEHTEQTADIIFVEEGFDAQNNRVNEISTALTFVQETVVETDVRRETPEEEDGTTAESSRTADAAADDATDEAAPDTRENGGEDEAASTTEDAANGTSPAGDPSDAAAAVSTSEEPSEPVVIMPAMSFADSIKVATGKPAGIKEDAGGTLANAADVLPEEAEVTVRVEADEGTFPAGTTMVLSAVNEKDMEALAETVTETVDNGDAASAAETLGSKGQKNEDQKNSNIKTYGFQAVDITFLDKNGKDIEPAKPVRVAMTSAVVEQVKKDTENSPIVDPVVVHVDNEGNAEQMDLVDPEEVKPAQGRSEEELLKEAEKKAQEEAEKDAAKAVETDGETGTSDGTDDTAVDNADNEKDENAQEDAEQIDYDTADSSDTEDESDAKDNARNDASEEETDATAGNKESDGTVADENVDTTVDNASGGETDAAVDNSTEAVPDKKNAETENATDAANENSTVFFTTDSFSVYAIVYTVELFTNVITDSGETYRITVTYDETSGIPQDAELRVREITENDAEYADYYSEAVKAASASSDAQNDAGSDDSASDVVAENDSIEKTDAGEAEIAEDKASKIHNAYARFFDIEIRADGQKVEPSGDVSVSIRLLDVPEIDDKKITRIVHFNTDGPEIISHTETRVESENDAETADTKAGNTAGEGNTAEEQGNATVDFNFTTSSFSVYSVVSYTVDFHWEVNGKSYTIIMPGGGFMSFSALVEALGTAKKDEQDKSAEEVQVPVVYNLNDIPVSQETKEFVADVESVVFSSPELMWVGKAETDISVGTLKEENKLKAQYSAGLTEEQIAQINAQMVEAGDWALISLKPFTSNETLTVTMKNGDQFVVNVTDAQDPSVFLGKDIIIYDNTEKQAMTSNYATDYRTHFNTVDEITADSNERARWKIEQTNGGYYLRSNDGKYLYLDHSNVRLVNNAGEATVLTIQAGGNPDYRIYAANNNQNALRYCDNNQYPGFFSAVDGTNGAGNSREGLYIREATAPVEPLGDWLLYFDDDFSGQEITIRVGETITLRPYNKWEWKVGNVDVQTDHWNVGTWNDWSISSSDGNGSKLTKTTDGPFEFTRYVKYDDQLITHYWSVQGRATQTGTYTLTNTKNNKTITVHVVDEPVDHPKTINKIANIKVNLFDYDKYGTLDGSWNNSTQWWNDDNHANDGGYKNVSVNRMGGSDHFYFLSSGGGNQWGESWNDYTHDDPNPLIVKNELGSDGYPVLNHGNNTSLKYLFDSTKTSWNGGSNSNDPDGMICYPDVIGMFQKDPVTGYYYFNSNTNYYYYDTDTGTSYLYEHTYTQASSREKNSLVNDKPIGFFPFHEYDSTDNLSVNQNHNLNHHIGMSMEVEFMLPRDRTDDNGEDIIFDFSGDDDLWVFVEWEDENGVKHSELLLDLGGVHQPIHGDINFTTGQNTEFMQTNRPYTLKVFYLERGGCDSNCSIKFNLPIIQDLNVAKKLTGLTEAEKEKYSSEEFWYELVIDRKPYDQPVPYNYPNPDNRYEKAVIRNAAGEDVTPKNFTITNGRFKLKDGETLTISYLDRTDKFTVAELKTDNMENFEVPNAERFYHQEHDASLYEEEITLTASHSVVDEYEDWVTPEYELEDTEKVTFTNTLKEKNLEVEKKWIGNQEHPESITFTVSATVDDDQGGRTPYAVAELKNDDGIADKVFTLNDDNDWRHEIEHLPVNTPDGKFIFYDIQEGHAEGYALTGIKDLTAENYNYCNIDVVKLWPDSNGNHTEVLQVVLKNSEGKYYAGVDNDGKVTFVDDINEAQIRELKPENNYSQRFDRLPYEDYTAEQLDEDIYNHGLATYKRAIIQYDLENTPLVNPVDPEEETVTPVIHKRIDALRDGTANPDSAHAGQDLTDLYRLYLDYKIDSLQDPNGVDLLFVIDHSGSMNDSHWPGNEYRAPAVMAALNGENGIIAKFLAANDKNRWAAVGFKGPDGFRDYEFALSNPWQPKENDDLSNYNAGQNGSEVLSSGGTSYAFTRNAASIELDNEGPLIQSNYTAGFWRAEQFLLKQDVKTDGRKKVVIFITDGVPTLHIGEPEADSLNGSLQNAGTASGSNYYREEYGGCPDKALTEFGYFVRDLTGNGNGYVFGGDNGNIDFYAIGLGALMQTEDSSDPDDPMSGSELLNGMLSAAYGQTVPANHYMTITDAASSTDGSAANTLGKDLRIILGLNDTFSNLVIQDDLSKYVDLYGLTAGSSASAIMNAAKAKVTMAVPDPEHPENPPQVITLYEDGAPVDNDTAKFTKADGTTKANIINRLEYDANSKTVKAVFDPEYHPAYDATYTLSFDVKATNDAYTTYAATGYDKYTSGEHQGQTIVGDEDTDFLGTTPANATSVDKPGFRSNDEAKATYVHNGEDEEEKYPHPVIQVVAYADIVKIDQTGAALEGAKFNLYDHRYDAGKTIEENAEYLIEADLQSKKPTDPPGDDAVIRSGKLSVGTYYLVETETPDGYNPLPSPMEVTVTEVGGVLNMTAKIAGEYVGGEKLKKINNGLWKLSVQNSAGYELPASGGPGTRFIYIAGAVLTAFAAFTLLLGRKQTK